MLISKPLLSCVILITLIYGLFFLASKKSAWNSSGGSTFECGFSSYFFSRFSFSIHYFMVGMIFLFLDLEICLVIPLFNGALDSSLINNSKLTFVALLALGLLYEWIQGSLDWKF